jgi:hypothetical protein
MKLAEREKKSTSFVVLSNPVNSEVWYCRDYNDTKVIDGVNYITVFKEENQNRTFLMRKDALKVTGKSYK